MEFVFGLLLGAILGVVAERLLGPPIDKFVKNPLRARFDRRHLDSINEKYSVQGELLMVGDSAIFVHQFFPGGLEIENLSAQVIRGGRPVSTRISESFFANDSVGIEVFNESKTAWETSLDADPQAWNGISLALDRCEVGRSPASELPTLSLWFRETDYATARAVEQLWCSKPVTFRRKIDGEDLRNVDPFLSNSFGLNCTIETADGKLLITRRGKNARGWNGRWHTSFNEGVSVADRLPGYQVDIVAAFGRGMKEEIGLDPKDVPNFQDLLNIHALILDVDYYQWGLLAHLDLRGTEFTSQFLRGLRNVGAAADDWEASEVRFIDFGKDIGGVLFEIEHSDIWVPHGLLNVALSTIVRNPTNAGPVHKALMLQGLTLMNGGTSNKRESSY